MAQHSKIGLKPAIHRDERFFALLIFAQAFLEFANHAAFCFSAKESMMLKKDHT